jgi:ketosteroid isomerase-like protein
MSSMSPENTVRAFLAAMENRDLAAAEAFLAAEFEMEFPGSEKMRTLNELIEWAKPRYRSVGKHYQRFDVADAPDGSAVIYCFGTLHGTWNDGTSFSDIRFIDRFTIVGGKIANQKVWNDIGEPTSR